MVSCISENDCRGTLRRLQRHSRHSAGYNSLLWIITTPTPEERSSGHESWGPCPAVLFYPVAPYCLLYFLPPTPKMQTFKYTIPDTRSKDRTPRTAICSLCYFHSVLGILILLRIIATFKQAFTKAQPPSLMKLTSGSERFDLLCG